VNEFTPYYIGRPDGTFWAFFFFGVNEFTPYYIGRPDGTFLVFSSLE
jgi:hypothetical protein